MDNPWSSPWPAAEHATKPNDDRSTAIGPAASSPPFGDDTDIESPWADAGGFGDWAVPEAAVLPLDPIHDFDSAVAFEPATTHHDVAVPDPVNQSLSPTTPRNPIPTKVHERVPLDDAVSSESPNWGSNPWAAGSEQHSSIDKADGGNISDPIDTGKEESKQIPATFDESWQDTQDTPGPQQAEVASTEPNQTPDGGNVRVPENQALSPARISLESVSDDLSDTPRADSPAPLSNSTTDDLPSPLGEPYAAELPDEPQHASKVQELVNMYDGMAKSKALLSRPPTSTHTRSPSPVISLSQKSEHQEDEKERISIPSETGQESDGDEAEPESQSQPIGSLSHEASEDTVLEYLDRLFPSLSSEVPARPAEIADYVHNTLNSISERKLWYRISRSGSSRKHNFGDDENYCHVGWADSAVHDQTLKIVRRWRLGASGTAVFSEDGPLGKGPSNLFSWDQTSSSDPVDLSILKRLSIRQSEPPKPTNPTTNPSFPLYNTSSPSPYASKEDTHRSPLGLSSPIDSVFTAAPTTQANTHDYHKNTAGALKPNNGKTLVIATSRPQKSESESEDEWGEMMSPNSEAPGTNPKDSRPVHNEIDIQNSKTKAHGILTAPNSHPTPEPTSGWPTPAPDTLTTSKEVDSTSKVPPSNLTTNTIQSIPPSNTTNFKQPRAMDPVQSDGPVLNAREKANSLIDTPSRVNDGSRESTRTAILQNDLTQEDTAVIEDIVKRLPDLSYMFR